MGWLIRAVISLALAAAAVVLAVAGVIAPFGMAANNGPASGQITPMFLAFGATLIASAIFVAWLAWRLRPKGMRPT